MRVLLIMTSQLVHTQVMTQTYFITLLMIYEKREKKQATIKQRKDIL